MFGEERECTACLTAAITSLNGDIWGISRAEIVAFTSKLIMIAVGLVLLYIARRRRSHPNAHAEAIVQYWGFRRVSGSPRCCLLPLKVSKL